MIEPRDEIMLEWLEEFMVATSKQLSTLFYSDNVTIANKRLLKFTKDKILYRTRDPWSRQYVYSLKPIKSKYQLKHSYIRNEFYIELVRLGCKINSFKVQKRMATIIPDLTINFTYKNKKYMYFVEVERSAQKIDISKYTAFFIKDYQEFITTPIPVVYITHKKVPPTKYTHIRIELDLSDIKKIL